MEYLCWSVENSSLIKTVDCLIFHNIYSEVKSSTMLQLILQFVVLLSGVLCQKPLLELNDTCHVTRTNSSGICQFIENCPDVRKEILRRGRFPTLCGFEGKKVIICCPQMDETMIIAEDLDQPIRISNKSSNVRWLDHCKTLIPFITSRVHGISEYLVQYNQNGCVKQWQYFCSLSSRNKH